MTQVKLSKITSTITLSLIITLYFLLAESTSTNYNVVDTDYDQYAVVYSCNNKLFFKSGKNSKISFVEIFCYNISKIS